MSVGPGPTVAVIGGGISGLVCAARLKQLGINGCTVFDTGKKATGGRCSSREILIDGVTEIFDHSAQYFTVSNPRFAKIVTHLYSQEAVKLWNGKLGTINSTGKFTMYPESYQAFIGCQGMQSISKCLSSMVDIKRPVWISSVQWESSCKKWKVDDHGYYDFLVVAHNGKCAERLLSNSGAPAIHRLLQVTFSDKVNPKNQRMQLCSIWCLLFAVPYPMNLKYDAAHVQDSEISWLSNNTSKYSSYKYDKAKLQAIPSLKKSSVECWTVFSTRSFGTVNKVPQENIPPKKSKEITQRLLSAFGRVTKTPMEKINPVFTKVQLWGAAVPMNVLHNKESSVFDPSKHVGICGDWLTSPSIEGASVSGLDLAEQIHSLISGKVSGTKLDPVFIPCESSDIGQFSTETQLTFTPKS